MKTLLRLSRLIAPLFPVMTLAVFFGTAGFLCAISIPSLGILALFEKFSVKLLILIGVARGVLHYAEQYCNHFIAFTLLARIRNIVFNKVRELGPAKLSGKQKGNLISILTGDIELLELFYAHTVSPVCIAFFTGAVILLVLFKIHFIFSVYVFVFYVVLAVFIPLFVQKFSLKAGSEHRKLFGQMNSFLLDTMRGLLQTILFRNGQKRLFLLKQKSKKMAESQKQMAKNEGIAAALIEGSVIIFDIISLIVSVWLFTSGKIEFSKAVFAAALIFSSFGPFIAVARLGSSLSQTIAAGKRVLSLLDEEAVVKTVENQNNLGGFSGAGFENVDFSYDSEKILSNLSLEIPENKIIGLHGKSGSGKSTALKLLMHFWEADSGTVSVSNLPVSKINTASLRKTESYVTQETILFHDTIENNIRIAKLDATDEEIVETCKKAGIHDFISSLPDGYKTLVSELGENFSGGERQRLGLARAFLHEGDFILLDEPTSNLDSYNEKIILDSVKSESSKKTFVLVSHRESSLKICDKIYKIETGRKS
ncbi:amino acid ABC transporter ATP-binding/permease protein [Treponema sp.]|uniref:amino acid ABC transporter ATP-binding/permease protein n=1 Tax=Treponema sp. TaxID=166 RepID=UPI0038900DB3